MLRLRTSKPNNYDQRNVFDEIVEGLKEAVAVACDDAYP
ncbi:hypothetical protein QBD00_000023 [Ochrobactrum sp. AN78]|nr:hypothetical protein [Ochrobactrum sp. AN78]